MLHNIQKDSAVIAAKGASRKHRLRHVHTYVSKPDISVFL
jgi:hypothetical protein